MITYSKNYSTYQYRGIVDTDDAFIYRKGDELTPRAGDVLSLSSGAKDKSLQLVVNEPTKLPALIADLALVDSEDSQLEEQGDFERRLSLRDDLATAFEEAAAKLRAAPRR